MKNQFVPYELAVKLKELGFNLSCLAYYTKDFPHHIHIGDPTWQRIILNNDGLIISAPLWQQAFDWFRKKYGALPLIYETTYEICTVVNNQNQWVEGVYYKSYEDARYACLQKLIEKEGEGRDE